MSLIDRDALAYKIGDYYGGHGGAASYGMANYLIAYLRTVITPEALAWETCREICRTPHMGGPCRRAHRITTNILSAIFGDTDE